MRRRLNGVEGGSLLGIFAKVLAASAVMGAVCWVTSNRLEIYFGLNNLFARALNVGAAIFIGVIVFYLAARLLQVNELAQLTRALERKFGGRLRRNAS
jgi:peptidoglycan biosynthesis protein MviN/MurJ (putative lipid II flippase)